MAFARWAEAGWGLVKKLEKQSGSEEETWRTIRKGQERLRQIQEVFEQVLD